MDPAVRVSWTRQVIDALGDRPVDVRDAVLARLPASTAAAVESGKRMGWITLPQHMEVCEAVRAELGAQGCRALFCTATVRAGQVGLFEPLISGFVALFGPTPATPIRASTRAWSFIFRDVGELVIGDLRDRAIRASLRGMHPDARATDTFALGVCGAFDACLEFVRYDGAVEMDCSELANGRVDYDVRWAAQRRG